MPINDEKEVPYKSTVEGVMHACGHDAHTASLLITAKILKEHSDAIHGNVVLIHQHAEEVLPGGARAMIEAGALDGVDYVFGTHTASHIDANKSDFVLDLLMQLQIHLKLKSKGLVGMAQCLNSQKTQLSQLHH